LAGPLSYFGVGNCDKFTTLKTYNVAIIDSGFGCQATPINLKKQGIDDFIILERRSFMGKGLGVRIRTLLLRWM
jgi:hypothetical protein